MKTNGAARKLSLICAAVACVLAAIVPWFYLPLCEPSLMDEGYQALCVADYRHSPLAMLIFYIGHVWTEVFGDSFLSLRRLSCLEGYVAIIMGCAYYWWRTKRLVPSLWLFVLCAVGAALDRHSIYNWDVGAFMFYTLSCVAMLEYVRRPTVMKAVIVGVTTVFVILARVQLLVLLPLFSAGILLYGRDSIWQRASRLSGFLAGAMISFLVVTTLMCGSVSEYVGAFAPENIITGHGPKDIDRWLDILKNNFCDRSIRWAVTLVSISVGWWLTVSTRHRRLNVVIGVGLLVLTGFAQGTVATVRAYCQFGMEVAMGGLMLFLLLLLPVYNVCHTIRINLPRWSFGVLWIWFCVPAFGSDYWFVRYGAFYLLPLGVAVISPLVSYYGHLHRLVTNVLIGALIGFSSALVGRFYAAGSHVTNTMDEFPRLNGLYSSHDSYLNWQRVKTLYDSASATGARVNIDGYRYAFAYSFQQTPITNRQLFHVGDNELNIAARRKVASQYDAWIYAFIRPEQMTGMIAMLHECGYKTVWEGELDGGDYYTLLMREPFAMRYKCLVAFRDDSFPPLM